MPELLVEARRTAAAKGFGISASDQNVPGGVPDHSGASPQDGKVFDELLLTSVDESLVALLGAKVKEAAYLFLERERALRRDDIPVRPSDFVSSLENVFGAEGSITIGRVIVKRLYSKLGVEFRDMPGYSFEQYLDEARAML